MIGESGGNEDPKNISQPVVIYTGSKKLADAKLRLDKWLDRHGI